MDLSGNTCATLAQSFGHASGVPHTIDLIMVTAGQMVL